MRITSVLALALALLCASSMAYADDIEWDHPWLTKKQLRWRENYIVPHRYLSYDSEFRYTEDARTITRTKFVLDSKDISELWSTIRVGGLSAAADSRVTKFKATFAGPDGVLNLSESNLVEYGDTDGSYVDGWVSLFLIVPQRGAGVLTLDIEIEHHEVPGRIGYFGGGISLHRALPTEKRSITIVAPTDGLLQIEERGFTTPAEGEPKTGGGNRTYTLNADDLWRAPREWGMPHPFDGLPTLLWSNQPDWATVGRSSRDPIEATIVINDEIRSHAEEVTAGIEGLPERVRAIHDSVAAGWTYLGFYPGESGWVPHPSDEVFEARYGDCKDKTGLMMSMMRSVGIDAHAAVLNAGSSVVSATIPTIISNHQIVYVRDPDHPEGGFFVDSTNPPIAAGSPGSWIADRDALVLFADGDPKIVRVPPADPTRFLHEEDVTVTIDADGLARVETVSLFHGEQAAHAFAQSRDRGEVRRRQDLERRIHLTVPGAKIQSLTEGPSDDGDTWRIESELHTSAVLQTSGDYQMLVPPWTELWKAPSAIDPYRRQPVEEQGKRCVHRMRVELPPGWDVASSPAESSYEGSGRTGSFKSTVREGGIDIELTVEVEHGRLPQDEAMTRGDLNRWLEDLQASGYVLSRSTP
jgi:transglutaminase-like putative cysteine protease